MNSNKSAGIVMSLPLVVASVLLAPLSFSTASAHGPSPAGCAMYYGREYHSELASFIVDNGQQQVDVLAYPNAVIPVERDGHFHVHFTLCIDSQAFAVENGSMIEANSSGTQGYAWYRDFANGYAYSKCAGPVEGGDGLEISQTYPVSHMFQGSGPHQIFFETTLDDSRPKAVFYIMIVDNYEDMERVEVSQNAEEQTAEEEKDPIPFMPRYDETEPASIDPGFTGDSLTINGSIASLALPINMGETEGSTRGPYIITGDWFMTVNYTAESNFEANVTVINSDGLERRNHNINNFTAVNASAVQFDDDTIIVTSSSTIMSDDSEQSVKLVLTMERLNVIRIQLDVNLTENVTGPIYGVVDKLVISEDGG